MVTLLVALLTWSAAAQPARDARATITVVDQTGAVIPNATVTLTPLTAPATPLPPVQTSDKGVAALPALAIGRYAITATFPGFLEGILKDVQIKAGDNKHVVVLALEGVRDSVTVSRDAREAASDRRSTFGTAMTREQIDALSDDPDEMAQQLQDMAGGGAVLRIDSFEGGRLPPKSSIKAIHITRDAFAAENHYAGGLFIDIITQPGSGPLRTNVQMRIRPGELSGKNELAAAKGPERIQNYNGGVSGTLIKQKASFSVNLNTSTQFETPIFNLYTPDGTLVNSLGPRRPSDNTYLYGLFDYALTRDQTLRVNYNRSMSKTRNLGIGGYDSAERGYGNEETYDNVRIQEAGPLGRRFFINTRANLGWSESRSRSVFEGQTIRVIDQFTIGGQQLRGGTRRKAINLQSDLDYVRGIHSFRTGLQLDGGNYHSDDSNNYLGTFTFESPDAFLAGTPRSYTQRVGDPNIDYKNVQAGVYVQDDIRVRKNLTLSPGLRYEIQTHLTDSNNFGPRFGITWSPGKAGTTTLRGSAGMFYDWLPTGIYEQTLRVDGFRQREVNITNPPYPNVEPTGPTLPTNRYLLEDGLAMQRYTRYSAGVDRAITKGIRINATYAHTSGDHLLRGLNLNQPVDGVRPDPAFSNVVQVVDDASSRQDTLNVGATINFNTATPGPAMLNGGTMIIMSGGAPPSPNSARWNWRRLNVFTNVGVGRVRNNTEGAFATPATGSIADDWAPSNQDVRGRFNVGLNSSQLRNFNASLNFNASTASPYTLRTGTDDNGDLVFNDRPLAVGRNTLRASPFWNLSGFFTYGWTFGKPVERTGGINIRSEGGGLAVSQAAAQRDGRFRLSLNVQIQNITNHGNLIGYSGVITSDSFMRPTSVAGTRKVDIGIGLSF